MSIVVKIVLASWTSWKRLESSSGVRGLHLENHWSRCTWNKLGKFILLRHQIKLRSLLLLFKQLCMHVLWFSKQPLMRSFLCLKSGEQRMVALADRWDWGPMSYAFSVCKVKRARVLRAGWERRGEGRDGCASGWPRKVPGERPLVEMSFEE